MALSKDDIKQLGHFLRPLATRLANMVSRGVVQLADASKKLQSLQVGALAGETVDAAEFHQAYGFSSVPLGGAEAVLLFPNGDRSHPIAVAVSDRRYRPTGGQGGEVCMYTDEGDVIKLGRGHIISLSTTGHVLLGSETAALPPALAAELAALKAAIVAWAPVPNDGGASLKAVFAAWSTPGATKVKVE